jgi:hypothetical protein
MYPPFAKSRIFAAVTCGDWLKSNSSIVFTRGSRASLIRRSIVFFSRSSISTVNNASRYAKWVVFSRMACSASVLNCAPIVGMRSALQCCLIVASCN